MSTESVISWSQHTSTVPQIPGPLRIMLCLLCVCSIKAAAKPGWQHPCSQHGLLSISSPWLRPTAQKKGVLSRCYYSLPRHLVTTEPWWRCTMRLTLFSSLLRQHPFCHPSVRATSTFKSYDLRNTLHKAIPAIDSDSSGWFWWSKLNTSGKDSHLRCHEEHSWFMGRGQNVNIHGSLKETDSSPQGWFWGRNGRCGGNGERTRTAAWRCDWIAAISWWTLWIRSCFLWMNK